MILKNYLETNYLKVLEKNLEGVLNTVSLSELNPGVYFFRLSGKYGQADHRIVKY